MKRLSNYLKHLISIIAAIGVPLFGMAQSAPIKVVWEMGENEAAPNMYSSTFTFTNISDKPLNADWDFYFNMFARDTKVIGDNPEFTISEFLPSYYKVTPNANYKTLNPGQSVKLVFLTQHSFQCLSYKPDGGHFLFRNGNEKVLTAHINVVPLNNPKQWVVPGHAYASYPDGKYMYKYNQCVNPAGAKYDISIYDIIPTPKQIKNVAGNTNIGSNIKLVASANTAIAKNYLVEKLGEVGIKVAPKAATSINLMLTQLKNDNPEYYELKVTNGKIGITASTEAGLLNGVKTLIAVLYRGKVPMTLPNVAISDYPDVHHRGMMLDIARNFVNAKSLKRYIDILAAYKINKYQFHFTDDEAWRLEIPGLPELTEVGSRKGYTTTEDDCLIQTYAGTGNPNDVNSSNGYVTRDQFIDLLQYAKARGVEVVPEIESPGHARAAIVSMKARERKYKATDPAKAIEYKMYDDNDTSKYVSSQGYRDNIMNFAQEGTYRFMEKVIDELIRMYADAGVQLNTIHIGGDEVPDNAWNGSPLIHEFLKKHNMKTIHEGSEYYLDRVSKMIADKGLKVGGWQEVGLRHSHEYNAKVAPRFNYINVWSTIGRSDSIAYHLANSGMPVVLSNVNNFYMDMVYNRHQNELGLNWGGPVDEFTTWNNQPYNIYRSARIDYRDNPTDLQNIANGKPVLKDKSMIKGVQGQIWAETIRSFEMVSLYSFPRIFGLMERGWNAVPVWGEDYTDMTRYNQEAAKYNRKIGKYELKRIKKAGLNFHLGQPGAIIEDGVLRINTQYPGEIVRYTLDGSEPTAKSTIWKAPVPCKAKVVKAKAFYLGKESLTTTLNN